MTEYTLIRPRGGLGPTFHEAAVTLKTHKDLTVKSGVAAQDMEGGGIYVIETTDAIAASLPEKLTGWTVVPQNPPHRM